MKTLTKRFIGEIERIEPAEDTEIVHDEHGFHWKECIRYIRLVGYRKDNQIIRRLPPGLKGKMVPQRRRLCFEPGYEWHFKTKHIDRPVLITFSKEETQKIEEELRGAEKGQTMR